MCCNKGVLALFAYLGVEVVATMAQKTEGHRLLREYKESTGVRQSEIARAISRTDPTVYAWLNGSSVPDVASAVALEKFTGGAVPIEAWASRRKRKAA